MTEMSEVQAQSSISQLLRAVGGWGGPGGPGLFMFRSIIVGFSTSAILGLTAASLAAAFSGPGALAFVIASSIGFVGGIIHYYHSSLQHVSMAADRYPNLMRLHLYANYPLSGWDRLPVSRESINRTWAAQSMAVSAFHSASPALLELHSRRETEIIGDLTGRVNKNTV